MHKRVKKVGSQTPLNVSVDSTGADVQGISPINEDIPWYSENLTEEGAFKSLDKFSLEKLISSSYKKLKEEELWDVVKKLNEGMPIPLRVDFLKDLFDIAYREEGEFLSTRKVSDKTFEEIEILEEFKKEKIRTTYHLAEYLTRKYNIITVGEKEREMFVYENGYYRPAENDIIFPEIQRILGEHTTKQAKTETFHKIADMTSYRRDVFTSAPLNLIPLANGVYDRDTKTLLPHSPEYRFTYQLPIKYDEKADCLKTKAFMEQIFTPEQLPSVQEWLGYYFYRQYLFKKATIFVGEGDTGKTTFLEVITHLLGRQNLSAISLQKMTSDKFAAAHLYEKHGNLVDELSAKDISDTGNFKMATGGGSITGEYKFGNQFSFLNFSKFTFACNKIPDVKDFDDEAYFNRWMVIRFEKTIEKKIPNFIASLTTEEERSGLFNFAMEGLDRLLLQGEFTYASSAIDTKMEMMRSGSSIAMFAVEGVRNEEGSEMSKADMYEAYSRFCNQKELAIETMDMFGKKFRFYVGYVLEGLIYDTTNPKGKRVRGWRNVALVKSEDESLTETQFNDF